MTVLDRSRIKRLLGIAIYSRALDYHRSGRVLQFTRRGNRLQGRVRGSEGNEYEVQAEIDAQGGLEEARCSCPYPDLCKHVGALLLRALEEGELAGGVEVEEGEEILELPGLPSLPAPPERQKRHGRAGLHATAGRAGGAPRGRTKTPGGALPPHGTPPAASPAVAGPAPAATAAERFRLVFVVQESLRGVDPSARRRWLLAAALRFLRQDGSYGRWQDFRPALHTEPAAGAERVLLAYLLSKEQYRDYLEPYLDLLASAPQVPLFLRAGREIKPLKVVEIQRAVVRFRLAALGSALGSALNGKEPLFVPEVELRSGGLFARLHPPQGSFQRGPLLYLIEETEGLLFYRKNDPELQRLLPPLLARAQPRPVSAIRELQALTADLPGTALQVLFPARRVRLLQRRPDSVLEIEEQGDGLALKLMFSYEGRLLPFPAREPLVALEGTDEEYAALRRAQGYENDRFLLLSALLQGERGSGAVLTAGVSGDQEASLAVAQGLGEFLLEHGQKLLEAGFELHRRGRRIRHVRSLSFVAHSSEDWLDLEVAAVGEDGERLALDPRLLEGPFLNREEACYLLSREDIARLQELARQGELKGGRYRLSPHHYGLIDSLYEQIANRDDGAMVRIRRIMEGLRAGAIEAVEAPEGFAGSLRDYQRAGLGWLWFLCRHGVNGCLADDMGLGKTVQTLALLQKLKGEGRLERALIVAPVSTLANWEQEVRRFTPELTVVLHHGAARARASSRLRGQDILLTSYHTLRQDLELLRGLRFTYVILDEAQTIKNPLSQIHRAARLVPAELRLSLTGTPLENRSVELWAQMSFLNPGLLGTLPAFRRRFARPIEEDDSREARDTLRAMIHPFILRRRKQDVLRELPPKEELLLYARMEPAQARAYAELRETYRRRVLQTVEEKGVERSAVLIFEALLKLRQAALFPGMASPRYERVPSCKFELLQMVLEEVLAEGHKVLIFSQFLESLRRIRAWVEAQGVGYAYLDGATRDRAGAIAAFQSDPATRLFLVSLRAGGLGINLTAADYVVLFDPWWNPAVEAQAVDRSHRIGRRGKVIVYRMITQETVEEKVLQLQDRKRRLMEDLVATDTSAFKSLTREDILRLFE